MKGIHFIAGVPRSGSTLLCNILNQNPEFTATNTSVLPELVGTMTRVMSSSPEIQALLAEDGDGTQKRVQDMLRAMIGSWYPEDKIVFDKSRGWTFQALLIADLYPDAKFIITVRDLRNVFASIEKQHRKTAMFDLAQDPNSKTILSRADMMFSPGGMIGQCVVGLEDIIARTPERLFVINYEALSHDPATHISELYEFLDLPEFKHSFKNIKNVSKEHDELYLNKFPHQGSGTVKKTNRNEWKEYITPDLAEMIHARYPNYNSAFGY